MEFTSPNDSFYLSAPNSPSDCSQNSMHFYSAPSSPIKRTAAGNNASFGPKTNEHQDDQFEFETSKRNFSVDGFFQFETSQRFESNPITSDHQRQQEQQQQKQHGNGNSSLLPDLPPMAFADELFKDGQVVPSLKLPPRLQFKYANQNQNSTASSPRSPSSVLKIPFSWRSMWNDDFDPFIVALENVKEGKSHHHRRTRSLSPFRTTNDSWNHHQGQEGPLEPVHHQMAPMESKGSAYARWVRHHNHNKQMGGPKKSSQVSPSPSPKIQPRPKELPGEKTMIHVKKGPEEPTKPVQAEEHGGKKIKGFLLKYASFRREKNETKLSDQIAALWKPTYFKSLSFKFKGNSKSNEKKKNVNEEPKMALAQYRPRLRLCLGYGVQSPRNIN